MKEGTKKKTSTPAFELGRVVATSNAMSTLSHEDTIAALFDRHRLGDWGDLCPDDLRANDRALKTGERLLSAYTDRHGTKFWIITEADRSVTTILLPKDY